MLWQFTSLYPENNAKRMAVYTDCLLRNLENTGIDDVLLEGEGFEVSESPKIRTTRIERRPLSSDFFDTIGADIFKLGNKVAACRMSDLLEDGDSGTLVDTGNTEGFAKSVEVLTGNSALRGRIGAAGRERCSGGIHMCMLEGHDDEAVYDALAKRGSGVARQGEVLHE